MPSKKPTNFGRRVKSLFIVIIALIVVTNITSTVVLRWTVADEKGQARGRLALILNQFEHANPWEIASRADADSVLAAERRRLGAVGLWVAIEIDSSQTKSAAITAFFKSNEDLPPFLGAGGRHLVRPNPDDLVRINGRVMRMAERARNTPEGRIRYGVLMSARTEGSLRDLGRADLVLRGAIMLAFVVFAHLFYRAIFLPYRDMRRQAQELTDTGLLPEGPVDDAEFVMQTFGRAVRRLSAQKRVLQSQYDLSERRARDLQRFNDYILRSLSTGIVIFDESARIVRINRSAHQILHMAPDKWVGCDLGDLRAHYTELADVVADGLERGRLASRDELALTLPPPLERDVHIGINTSRIYNDREEVVGLAVLISDLTELKRLYSQLAENRRMADLGEMTAGLAHQLRNAMAAMVGFGRLLRDKCAIEEPARRWLDSMLDEARDTEAMVERFLNFARPLSGDLVPGSLDRMLREAIDSVRQHVDRLGVRIVPPAEPEVDDTIFSESIMLRQVFVNLLMNAAEATAAGGTVTLSVTPPADAVTPGANWVVRISDEGPGIPKAERDRIFRPFHTTKDDGTGLGLPLARKIVTYHGGTLELESAEPGHTVFCVALPVGGPAQYPPPRDRAAERELVVGRSLVSEAGRNGYVPRDSGGTSSASVEEQG